MFTCFPGSYKSSFPEVSMKAFAICSPEFVENWFYARTGSGPCSPELSAALIVFWFDWLKWSLCFFLIVGSIPLWCLSWCRTVSSNAFTCAFNLSLLPPHWFYFLDICLLVCATPVDDQGLLLTLCLVFISGRVQGTKWDAGGWIQSTDSKACAIPTVQSLYFLDFPIN